MIWACLVEEPTLFLRTFLEKITVRDRQVHVLAMLTDKDRILFVDLSTQITAFTKKKKKF